MSLIEDLQQLNKTPEEEIFAIFLEEQEMKREADQFIAEFGDEQVETPIPPAVSATRDKFVYEGSVTLFVTETDDVKEIRLDDTIEADEDPWEALTLEDILQSAFRLEHGPWGKPSGERLRITIEKLD